MAEVVEQRQSLASLESQGASDARELKLWLTKSNCQHHYSRFVDHGVTYELLPELDTDALREMGVSRLGDRLRLELAIQSLKNERLQNHISVDELQKLFTAHFGTGTPGGAESDGSRLDALGVSDLATLLPLLAQEPGFSSLGATTSSGKDQNKNITFILQDGSLKRVNVTGCFNAQLIKRKVLRKLGLKLQELRYDTYIHSETGSVGLTADIDKGLVSLLFDVELVTICYSPERLEKHRIILCPKNEYPTDAAIEMSRKIMHKYRSFSDAALLRTSDLSEYHMPETRRYQPPTMRNFFGQRPPSELISLNLAEYFPEAHQRDLEATVRNSVRYSVRLLRRFQLPASIGGSNSSVNGNSSISKRMSVLSNATVTTQNRAMSLYSTETALVPPKRLKGRTIGDMMVNNLHAIEEVLNTGTDSLSIGSKPHSGTDVRSIELAGSSNRLPRHRLSISASFADPSGTVKETNRYSRIELLNIDSDEDEDDFISEYGTYLSGELGEYDGEAPVSDTGQRKWLQGARIGAGSFGTVYLGMDPFTGELMAVKQVSLPDKTSINNNLQKLMIEALEHEMTLLKELNHENIVRYFGSSTDDNFLNIFLEYVPGGSVLSMLLSYGPFEEPLIRNFIRQVLIGLIYLHGENIIHRDIKGANILIDIKGTVKISDFGISKKVGHNVNLDEDAAGQGSQKRGGRRASLQGLVYWMAPEVVKQTAYTKKADIWLVGCLIVEMFTGKHPFPDFSQMQAIFKIGTHITPQIPEWCTAEAKDFLVKTFELDYENRPDAVDMLGEAFLNPLILSKQ